MEETTYNGEIKKGRKKGNEKAKTAKCNKRKKEEKSTGLKEEGRKESRDSYKNGRNK